ncbi:hypothetical protein HDU79_003512 [Rhizoclosmatium sp. JEL0117]|nr:hypothetical protein HDU79_003512 [Rhizoclosmatium sp. JEL0117]
MSAKCKKRDKDATGRFVTCNADCTERISNSEANKGRPYWSCPTHVFSHWTSASWDGTPQTPTRSSASASTRYSPYTPATPVAQAAQRGSGSSNPPPYQPLTNHYDTFALPSTPPATQSHDHHVEESHPPSQVATPSASAATRARDSFAAANTALEQVLLENQQLRAEIEELRHGSGSHGHGHGQEELETLRREVEKLRKVNKALREAVDASE